MLVRIGNVSVVFYPTKLTIRIKQALRKPLEGKTRKYCKSIETLVKQREE